MLNIMVVDNKGNEWEYQPEEVVVFRQAYDFVLEKWENKMNQIQSIEVYR